MPRAIGLLAVAAILPGLAGCGSELPERPNVLFLVVDTLRADGLGCYGAERGASPAIDAFAAGSVRFERAYSSAPWTVPSVATMLTGLHPSGHGVVRPNSALPRAVPLLPEVLRGTGYRTAAVSSNAILEQDAGWWRGYDTFDDSQAVGHRYVSTEGVADRTIARLEEFAVGEDPFFLFALFFDPHNDYMDHREIDYATRRFGRLRAGDPLRKLREIQPGLTADELAYVRALYDEEIRHTDDGIARVLERLAALGLEGDTVVVLVSDHGEAFLDHGWLGHTRDLYDELVRVPLVIRVPGARSRVVHEPVSLVSLTPTILELTGAAEQAEHGAPSLVRVLLDGASPPEEGLYFEVDFVPLHAHNQGKTSDKDGVVVGFHKLIRDRTTGLLELYDLVRDPGETRNLAEVDAERTRALLEVLESRAAAATVITVDGGSIELDAEALQQLEHLGYGGR